MFAVSGSFSLSRGVSGGEDGLEAVWLLGQHVLLEEGAKVEMETERVARIGAQRFELPREARQREWLMQLEMNELTQVGVLMGIAEAQQGRVVSVSSAFPASTRAHCPGLPARACSGCLAVCTCTRGER
jgi:hypothetical protein